MQRLLQFTSDECGLLSCEGCMSKVKVFKDHVAKMKVQYQSTPDNVAFLDEVLLAE